MNALDYTDDEHRVAERLRSDAKALEQAADTLRARIVGLQRDACKVREMAESGWQLLPSNDASRRAFEREEWEARHRPSLNWSNPPSWDEERVTWHSHRLEYGPPMRRLHAKDLDGAAIVQEVFLGQDPVPSRWWRVEPRSVEAKS